jgi:hypothetical protein
MRNDLETHNVPDILLEQYRLNELTPVDAGRVRRALDRDPALRERLATLERSDNEIASRYPPGWLAERIRERRAREEAERRRSTRFVRQWVLPIAFAGAAAALAFTVPAMVARAGRTGGGVVTTSSGEDRVKGLRPSLVVYRRTDRGSETLADGAVAKPGDVVRLGYSPGDRAYGVILSIDTRGTVTRHLPSAGSRAAVLAHERVNLLDTAYELDDVPGWERFYFIASDTAFDVAPIVDAVRRTAASADDVRRGELSLPRNFDQYVFLLQKEVSK